MRYPPYFFTLLLATACVDSLKTDTGSIRSHYVDLDGDGYTPDQGDCDDTDVDVNPGADETCNDMDDDCDGDVDEDCDTGDTGSTVTSTAWATTRLLHVETPSLNRHAAFSATVVDATGVVLVTDADASSVYGWSVNSTQSEDIALIPSDAPDFIFTDTVEFSGYAIRTLVTDNSPGAWTLVCFTEDYWDSTTPAAADAGRIVCFRDTQITAGATLTPANAVFIAQWTHASGYAGSNVIVGDFNSDGKGDLLMGGGDDGLMAVDYDAFTAVKSSTTFPVIRNYPADADAGKTFYVCDKNNDGTNDGSAYCQADMYVDSTHSLIVVDAKYNIAPTGALVESFNMAVWPPAQTGQIEYAKSSSGDFPFTNMSFVAPWGVLVANHTNDDEWVYLDPVSLSQTDKTTGPAGCSALGQYYSNAGGVPYLWLGCPGETVKGASTGAWYGFDITAGLPSSTGRADVSMYSDDSEYGGFAFSTGAGTDGGDILAVANSKLGSGGTLGMDVYALTP